MCRYEIAATIKSVYVLSQKRATVPQLAIVPPVFNFIKSGVEMPLSTFEL